MSPRISAARVAIARAPAVKILPSLVSDQLFKSVAAFEKKVSSAGSIATLLPGGA
jgi:hypothetical protein